MKDIPYFPKIVSVEHKPVLGHLVLNIDLYSIQCDEDSRVVFIEKAFGKHKPALYYNFSIKEPALKQLDNFFEDPVALSGIMMNFRVFEDSTWQHRFTRLHSLLAKKLYLQYNGLDISLHHLEEEDEAELV